MSFTASLIETPRVDFVITSAPTDLTIERYVQELKKYNTQALIQVCEPNIYDPAPIEDAGIQVINWNFPDGTTPSVKIVRKWLLFLKELSINTRNANPDPALHPVVAVHCIAGLGRAPMMVAIAMIETGMPATKAIEFIRERRPNSFNSKQIQCLARYKPVSGSCSLL